MRAASRPTAAILAAAVACLPLLVAGCTGSVAKPESSHTDGSRSSDALATTSATSTSPSAPSTSPASSTYSDLRVAAAVRTYEKFSAAANYAQANPPKKIGDPLPKPGNFRPYSFDPAQGQVLNYIFSLTRDGIEYRGAPPTPRISVTSVDLAAAPYPTVTLTDCPTAPPKWTTYYRATGKPTGDKPGQVKPPYLVTIQEIFYKKHWGVYKLAPDSRRTCTPP